MTKREGGAGMLIALQAGSRLCNMLFAQMQVRLASAEVFGAANIHLELLLGTTLNIAREGVRNALSRQVIRSERSTETSQDQTTVNAAEERRIRNVALLPIPVGLVAALLGVTLYARRLAPLELTQHSHFGLACAAFLSGIVLELVGEPLFVAALRAQHLKPRIWAEGAGTLARGMVTLATMVWLQKSGTWSDSTAAGSMLPFGLGQMAYGAAFLAVFAFDSVVRLGGVRETGKIYAFGRLDEQGFFDVDALRLSRSMAQQNIVKHCLGEADKFAVARLTSLKEQGAYALASNYGSLVARLLYQPVEEISRLTFAAKLGSVSTTVSVSKAKANDVRDAEMLLGNLLAFHVLLASFLVVFCPPLATPLLVVIAGQRWATQTQAPVILSVYGSTYLPAMAFNGLLEGFLQACASPSELTRYDGVLIGASASYVTIVSLLTTFNLLSPEIALIVSSSISTCVRAAYSYRFATRFLQSAERHANALTMKALRPSPLFALVMLSSAIPLWRSAHSLSQNAWQLPWNEAALNHLILGISLAVLCATTCMFVERRTLLGAYRAVAGRR